MAVKNSESQNLKMSLSFSAVIIITVTKVGILETEERRSLITTKYGPGSILETVWFIELILHESFGLKRSNLAW